MITRLKSGGVYLTESGAVIRMTTEKKELLYGIVLRPAGVFGPGAAGPFSKDRTLAPILGRTFIKELRP